MWFTDVLRILDVSGAPENPAALSGLSLNDFFAGNLQRHCATFTPAAMGAKTALHKLGMPATIIKPRQTSALAEFSF